MSTHENATITRTLRRTSEENDLVYNTDGSARAIMTRNPHRLGHQPTELENVATIREPGKITRDDCHEALATDVRVYTDTIKRANWLEGPDGQVYREEIECPFEAATYDTTGRYLGRAARGFQPYQNEQLVNDVYEHVVESGRGEITKAVLWKGGREAFIQFKLHDVPTEELGQGDKVDLYGHVLNGHTSARAIVVGAGIVRAFCENQSGTFAASGLGRAKHTGSVDFKANQLVGKVSKIGEKFRERVAMFAQLRDCALNPMGRDEKIAEYLKVVYNTKNDPRENLVDRVMTNFQCGRGNEGRSWWDLFNAVTEDLSWNEGNAQSTVGSRFADLQFGTRAKKIEVAYNTAIAMSGIAKA